MPPSEEETEKKLSDTPASAPRFLVFFVCNSNLCRSPLAAEICSRLMRESGRLSFDFQFTSAGSFSGAHSRPAERRTLQLASAQGLDLSEHKTRELSAEDLRSSQLVVVLDVDSYGQVKRLIEEFSLSVRLDRFVDYFGDSSLVEIPDPVLGEIEFDDCFRQLEKGCRELCRKLKLKD